MNQVLQFAEAFSQKNGVEFSIEPAAISGIVAGPGPPNKRSAFFALIFLRIILMV